MQLMIAMLESNPVNRPTVTQCLAHPCMQFDHKAQLANKYSFTKHNNNIGSPVMVVHPHHHKMPFGTAQLPARLEELVYGFKLH